MLARIRFLTGGLTVLTLLLFGASASAVWRVDFESKIVMPNETGVTVNLKVYWDLAMITLTVPVIVRSVSGGAFWSLPLPVDTAGGPVVGVEWNWSNPGWANLVENVMPGPPPVSSCSGGYEGDTGYDGVSPDHFVVNANKLGPDGTPAEPNGRNVVILTIHVNNNTGVFEFDTACYKPSLSKIWMVGRDFKDHGPGGDGGDFDGFNKGVITIVDPSCDCGVWGDVNDDGQINPQDVTYMVQFVYFQNDMRVQPPNCPLEAGDVTGDGSVKAQDVTYYVQYVYMANDLFCDDPCGE